MLYCFLTEEINNSAYNLFTIQKEYAQRIDAICIGNIERQKITDTVGKSIDFNGKKVLLRCTYDSLSLGFKLLEKYGVDTVETATDVGKIENWLNLGLVKRQILEIELSELLTSFPTAFNRVDKVFLKSKHKGFSAIISTSRIVQHDFEVIGFLESQCEKYGNKMLLSKYIPIKLDSLGLRESRHFIFDNKVANSSRLLHSIKHTVPKSHTVKAQEFAQRIKEHESFPSNYVLDIGEFVDDNENAYLDIVEINPVSCSTCYVNNSIFSVTVPEIKEYRKQLLMGWEFCYDAMRHPQNYFTTRLSNKNYNFEFDSRHLFL